MLLEELRNYSERLDLPPKMYKKTAIRWLIDLDQDGNLLNFVATEGVGRGKHRGKEFLAPHIMRAGSVVRAKLLTDNGEYALGVARNETKLKQVRKCHLAFVNLVEQCAAATREPIVHSVLKFLERLDVQTLRLPEDFDASHILTFRVANKLPIDLPSVRTFWASASIGPTGDDQMECLICGQLQQPVKRLQFKIKGIPGGQPAGTALISANEDAYESYGLEASLIAPTCQECGERFSKAANALIADEETRIRVGPLVYVFWTKEESDFSVASILSDPQPDEVKALIKAAFSGQEAAVDVETSPFYAAAFSASGARVTVRDWLDTTVDQAKRHLARYFGLQRIVDTDGAEGHPIGLYALAASTVRDVSRELPPNVPKVLLHMALKGGPLPSWLLFQAVKRNRAEQRVPSTRAALIKMVLLSQQSSFNMEDDMVQLDQTNQDPAYLCGRLFAILESVQHAAIGKATITDRFFGAASSAPASVYGLLLRGVQAHLSKLRNEKPGAHEALQRRLEEVQAGLTSFPKMLTLQQQGVFSLGYYHQRAEDRARALAYKQAKRDDKASNSEGTVTE